MAAKVHRRASTCLQAAGRGEGGGERGVRKETMKSVGTQFPIKDMRRGFGRPCLLWHPEPRTMFAQRVHNKYFCNEYIIPRRPGIPPVALVWVLDNARG